MQTVSVARSLRGTALPGPADLRYSAPGIARAEVGRRVSTEADLVLRAKHGDADAYGTLVDAHFGRLYALAVRIVRDRDIADDCTQEAFVAAWRDLPGLRDASSFPAWVRRILMRICHRQLEETGRSTGRIRTLDVEVDAHVGAPDPVEDAVRRDQLERAFGRLRAVHRIVVVLFHYEQLRIAQIADLLGVPAGTIASRLHYAHAALRAAVEADDRSAYLGSRR